MGTIKTVITDAMLELNVLTEGDEPDGDQLAHGMRQLQGMLAEWSISGLMVPYRVRENFALTVGVSIYPWALGQAAPGFNSAKPNRIIAASFELANYQKPLIEADDRLLLQTALVGNIAEPTFFFLNKQIIPQLILDVPAYSGSISIVSEKALDTNVALTDTVVFPEHYQLLLKNNLAVVLAPKFNTTVSPELAYNARTSKAAVAGFNAQAVPSMRHNVPGQRKFKPLALR